MYAFSSRVANCPVIPRSIAQLTNKEILGVIDVLVRSGLDAIQDLSGRSATLNPWD